MDPIRSLQALVAGGVASATEGKVESRDDRKGTVVVRLAGNETVEARGTGLKPGDRVAVARSPDGVWVARTLQRSENQVAPVLSSWMTEPPGSELGEALRSGEPRMIRSALVALWRNLDSASARELPPALQEARRRGMPPLVSRSDAPTRPAPSASAVPLALRAEVSPGLYRGEIPGRRLELSGPPGIRLGEAGLWTESVLSEILSVWLPTAVEDGAVPGLPPRVATDASGARRLLDHLGVDLSPQEAESPAFEALVRSLVRAGSLFAGEDSPDGPAFAVATRGSLSRESASPAAAPSSGAAPGAMASPEIASVAPPIARGVGERPIPADAAGILDPLEVLPDRSGTGEPSEGVGSRARTEPNAPSILAGIGAETGSADASPAPSVVPAETDRTPRATTSPATFLASPDTRGVPPSDLPVPQDGARAPTPPVRELPSAVALRVVLAWLVAPQEPSEALLRAAVGGFRDLPEALQILARAQDLRPEDFEAVATFLKLASPEEPLLPRDLGLDRPARGAAASDPLLPAPPPSARPLSQAIVEDLARALSQGRNEDAAILREALGSLVGEALDRARDPSNPTASAPWTMPPSRDLPDSGRVIVRDRRKSQDASPDRTVVEVSMNPSGLGSVDARLELRGDDLDVVFHARESATVERIREHLPELRDILVQLGLQPRELDARAGRPGAAKRPAEAKEAGGGLDIRA